MTDGSPQTPPSASEPESDTQCTIDFDELREEILMDAIVSPNVRTEERLRAIADLEALHERRQQNLWKPTMAELNLLLDPQRCHWLTAILEGDEEARARFSSTAELIVSILTVIASLEDKLDLPEDARFVLTETSAENEADDAPPLDNRRSEF